GAYVPLDPSYPKERLEFMLKDTQAPLLLTQKALRKTLPKTKTKVVCLDEWSMAVSNYPTTNPIPATSANNLAYVIYTSGSTGQPKGVMVEHRNVVNLLQGMGRELNYQADYPWVSTTTLSFDIAALELYLPLISGAKLIVAPDKSQQAPEALMALLVQHDAKVLQATPTGWRALLDNGVDGEHLIALVGGEALPKPLAIQLREKADALYNCYGPTETTIWSLVSSIQSDQVS
ncbi:TPA: AMP-binding protein, partial [Legionella pneumophila]|nr:AMP-binding protein [Legionella pneumophila]